MRVSFFFASVPVLAAGALALVACSASSAGTPGGDGDDTPTPGRRADALVYRGACTPQSCPPFDPGSTSNVATCSAPAAGSCDWSTDPDQSVSFRACPEAECGGLPAIGCPDGYALTAPQCGSENEAACGWQQRCTPKPTDIACPDDQCPAERAAIAAICSEDGGFEGPTADWKCRKNGAGQCTWQAVCP